MRPDQEYRFWGERVEGRLCNERSSSVKLNLAEIQSTNNTKHKRVSGLEVGRASGVSMIAFGGYLRSSLTLGLHSLWLRASG